MSNPPGPTERAPASPPARLLGTIVALDRWARESTTALHARDLVASVLLLAGGALALLWVLAAVRLSTAFAEEASHLALWTLGLTGAAVIARHTLGAAARVRARHLRLRHAAQRLADELDINVSRLEHAERAGVGVPLLIDAIEAALEEPHHRSHLRPELLEAAGRVAVHNAHWQSGASLLTAPDIRELLETVRREARTLP